MIGFLIRRIVQSLVVILGVLFIVFLLTQVIPGGEARAVLGSKATAAKIHQFNVLNGFTLPIWDQFYQYLLRLIVHQDLGYSYSYNQTVSALISDKLPKTLVLVGISTLLALVVSIPLGILQVVRRNKPVDYVLTGLSFIFYAMPASCWARCSSCTSPSTCTGSRWASPRARRWGTSSATPAVWFSPSSRWRR